METALEPWAFAALLGAGVAAGFINVLAGGGSLITMPLLIFLGLPANTSNGTARVAIFVQNLSAMARYRRAGRLDLSMLARLAPAALIGALCGAALAHYIGDAGFKRVLGWVMLGCAVLVVLNPKAAIVRAAEGTRRDLRAARVWPVLFVIGFYGGLVQAGVGYLILAGLTMALGLELVEANILKVVIVFVYTPIALAVFFWQGQVQLWPGLVLACGQAAGAWVAASLALEKGAGLIRLMLAVVVLLSAIKLLWYS